MNFFKMLDAVKAQGQVKVLAHLVQAQPFIAELNDKETTSIYGLEKLDLPFKVCSFESSDPNIQITNENNDFIATYYCIVAEEIEPKKIIFYADMEIDGVRQIRWVHPNDGFKAEYDLINGVVAKFLETIKNGQHGTTSPRHLVKWKENGEKKQARINKVIHIRPRGLSESEGERNVNWSHAFWVMGHWRDISGVGKDRDGNYTVNGMTWVVPHVRKAELGDPINKIRLVKN